MQTHQVHQPLINDKNNEPYYPNTNGNQNGIESNLQLSQWYGIDSNWLFPFRVVTPALKANSLPLPSAEYMYQSETPNPINVPSFFRHPDPVYKPNNPNGGSFCLSYNDDVF